MNLQMDLFQPPRKIVGSLPPSHLWTLDRPLHRDGTPVDPDSSEPSSLAECECPDDCPRDHENE